MHEMEMGRENGDDNIDDRDLSIRSPVERDEEDEIGGPSGKHRQIDKFTLG